MTARPFPGLTSLALGRAARLEQQAGASAYHDVRADLLAAGRNLREAAGQHPQAIAATQVHNVEQGRRWGVRDVAGNLTVPPREVAA